MPHTTLPTGAPAPASGSGDPRGPVAVVGPPDVATVLLVGFPGAVAEELAAAPPHGSRVVPLADPEAVLRALGSHALRAVCLGPSLTPAAARSVADRVVAVDPSRRVRILVLAAGERLERFQDLIDDDRLFYLAARPPGPAGIRAILESALAHRTVRGAGGAVPLLAVEWLLRLLAMLEDEDDPAQVSRHCAQAVQALVDADGGECLILDDGDDTLSGWRPGSAEMRRQSAAAGLVGWVARTATRVRLERAGADPRYEPEADGAGGPAEQRLLAVPAAVVASGAPAAGAASVRAVLVARRSPDALPFDDVDEATLTLLGEQVGSALGRLSLRRRVHGGPGGSAAASAEDPPLFRAEALARRVDEGGRRGRPLALAPAWTRRTYQLLLWLSVASLAILSWGSVHEYAEGVAVVRVEDRVEVTATTAGVVEATPVRPGQRVEAGEVLVRLDAAREAAELDRLRRELELALVERLRDPTGQAGQGTVGALREQVRLAEARLEERSIRASRAGVLGESRVEAGQPVSPGQTVATLVPGERSPDGRPWVVALFPGRYRPLLAEGMALRLELEGHRGVRHRALIGEVGDAVVGPAEARRILGADIADAVPIGGPVVFVRARLSSESFASGGRTFRYHEGLVGGAEVRVRAEGLLTTLVPGLKGLFGGADA